MPAGRRAVALLASAGLLLVATISAAGASDTGSERAEPAPEPYSFSYQAESAGGFSSHQESGDGSGRVQGFYIIMGEDGRDRRVDYVADENGYRASISTNEVGTRTESSADAQYSARLPSQGQLDQAKVSAEEYKFLEEQHATERERHLAGANSGRHQQQQQQQGPPQSAPERQLWAASGADKSQTGQQLKSGAAAWSSASQQAAAWNQQPQPQLQPQPQQPSYEPANSTAAADNPDEGWRRGAAAAAKLIANQSLNQSQQQAGSPAAAPNSLTPPSPSSSSSSLSSWTNQLTSEVQQQQQQQLRARPSFGSLASATTAGPIATLLNAPPAQRQQAQQAAWQLADRGAAPARLPSGASNINSNNNNFYLQRQLEQQFMQQAVQLTDQDYPRQQAQVGSQGAPADYGNLFVGQQQAQQPQKPPPPQPQPQPQRPWQVTSGNDLGATTSGGDYGQVSQQQNNIIDEVTGDQLEAQVTGGPDEASKSTAGANFSSSTSMVQLDRDALKQTSNALLPQAQVQVQQQQQRPQFVQPMTTSTTTTTTSAPAPSGFFAINLSQENSTSNAQTNQQVDLEADSRQTQVQQQQNFVADFQSAYSGGQRTNEQSAQDTGDHQRKTIQQQQQQTQPTKQTTEATGQQTGGSYVESGQAKQQASFQKFVPTSTQDSRPYTTTQAPELSTVAIQQQHQAIETSQAPLRPLVDLTTTTTTTPSTTTSQRPALVQQSFVSSSVAPLRESYDTSSVDVTSTTGSSGLSGGSFGAFLRDSSQKPSGPQGVKGRFPGASVTQSNASFVGAYERPVANQRTVVADERKPIGESAQSLAVVGQSTTAATPAPKTSGATLQPAVISDRPEVINGNRLVLEQPKKQRPTLSFDSNRQRQQTSAVTGGEQGITTTGGTPTTAAVATTATGPVVVMQQPQQQQQQWKGVKGGSKTARRQFWLQAQPQQPLIPSGQRVLASLASQQLQSQPRATEATRPTRASVDYATSVSSFGSRLSGR